MLLIAGIGLLVPRTGWATCGDYLAMPGHAHVNVRLLQEQIPVDVPERPCQGPHCRRAPAPTVPAAPVALERHVEQWALLPTWDAVPVSRANSLAVRPQLNGGAAHPLRIDRPPR